MSPNEKPVSSLKPIPEEIEEGAAAFMFSASEYCRQAKLINAMLDMRGEGIRIHKGDV